MKGVSPLIAAVVLIAFTITIAFIVATWGTSFIQSQTEDVSSQIGCLGALTTGSPQFYPGQSGGVDKIAISVTNLKSKIVLENIKLSVYYEDATQNLENLNTGITLNPGDTKTVVQELVATEKPESVRVVAGNCPNSPRVASGIVEGIGSAPTTSVSTVGTTTTSDTTSTVDTSTTVTTVDTTTTETTIATTSVTTTTIDTSLVAHYEFEGDETDSSENNRNGIVLGDVVYVAGKIGQAAQFDGDSDRVLLPGNDPVWLPSGDFSLAAWVYFNDDDTVTDYILDMNHGDSSASVNEVGYALRRSEDGFAEFYMTTSDTDEDLVSNTVLSSGIWYHLVAVRDGTFQKLYIDGGLDDIRTCQSTPIDFDGGYDNNEINIGGFTRAKTSSYTFWLNGLIDDVRIYNRALTTQEIEDLYGA